jgi:hypothetical protein
MELGLAKEIVRGKGDAFARRMMRANIKGTENSRN